MTANALKLMLVTACLLSSARADEILVITGYQTELKNASIKQLKNIFLRQTLLNESGTRWIPLNLSPSHPLRLAFSQSLFKQLPEDMESYWNEQYFQGITPPYVVASEEAMLRFVTDTAGAIGYILPCHLDKRVQVVFKLTTSDSLKQSCNKENH
jgi:hypothetical protein